MTLNKAIRRFEHYLKLKKPEPIDNFNATVQLGIEVMEQELKIRRLHPGNPDWLLPSETID